MKVAQEMTPLELLTKGDEKETFINPYLGYIVGGILGFTGVVFSNLGAQRPMLSGIQRHIIFGTLGAVAMHMFQNYGNNYYAERDAIYRHYIELHPEDFPKPERKKVSAILENWGPIR